jgi:hypothetical protein
MTEPENFCLKWTRTYLHVAVDREMSWHATEPADMIHRAAIRFGWLPSHKAHVP